MKKLLYIEIAVLAVLVVAALVVAVSLGNADGKPQISVPTAPSLTEPENTQATEVIAPTEPLPTEPFITWMTFPEDRVLTAKQYFVYEVESGSFLKISGSNNEKIYPASITKLFTAYVAMQFVEPDHMITATDALDLVAYGSSVADLVYKETISAERLVEAMLLPSGNDAAYVLAAEVGRILDGQPYESASKAVATFMAEMNRQARELGLTGTNFVNPDGIHKENHYSTPADLVKMAQLSLSNDTVMKYAKTVLDEPVIDGVEHEWENTNELVHPESEFYCPYAVGLKTGQTPKAGSCLLSAFQFEGQTLIIGVFGCPDVDDRFADTLQLLNEILTA